MKKTLTIATFLTFIAMPAFAQAFDPDVGTGNIVPPPVTNQNGASAYGQARDAYETGYTRAQTSREIHHPAHRSRRTGNRPAYYGAYAFSPGYYSNYTDNPWSRSRSLNHGQGPGCIQSPASLEYTGCD
jgi:hypothetical protein